MSATRRSPSGLGVVIASHGLVRVSGASMHPTLDEGDWLLVNVGRPVMPGDLVVVRLPGRPGLAVKRAVRQEGDGWWVERDNPRAGIDSWVTGPVPLSDVVAQVVLRVWPPRRIGAPPAL